ncbi:hypothetical protein [Agrobacterium vitis]|uniref:hypothetical protein n=1 Tax=Agrobacterium vitis TaxID=373 RepID=UPI000872C7AC|nr:hypothetical protein [Agrobacterium vitis]MCE6075466.1 hypothetical protein [Agrobacterium vitis]MCM2450639.1 hypothetical protein [Agrobacterium vitis]MCM2467944.1 hypothetical protein [Agrobacterium vitis]MUO72524.1 hypothetical protein [Agrobacterium vitis]MUO87167.1 hypothetical protein [Agrobacterium vitis]
MPRLTPSAPVFHRKIETFCEVRLAPALAKSDYQNLRSYMLGLIVRQATPPLHGGRPNWKEIGATCLLSEEGLVTARREGRHAFEAIMRWVTLAQKAKAAPAPAPTPVAHPAAAKTMIRPVGMRTVSANSNRRPVERMPAATTATTTTRVAFAPKKAGVRG